MKATMKHEKRDSVLNLGAKNLADVIRSKISREQSEANRSSEYFKGLEIAKALVLEALKEYTA